MTENATLGICTCPNCNDPEAEIRQGQKGKLYIICPEMCMTRSLGRRGQAAIRARLTAAPAAPAPAPTEHKADAAPEPAAPAPTNKPAKPAKKKEWWQ